jgi:flagellar motility protein MotE (MotC chaperone)
VKQKLIYGGVFLLAFLLVTGGIVYMNSIYKNVFLLDFSQKHAVNKDQMQDLLKTKSVAIDSPKIDSSKIQLANNIQPDSTVQVDSASISEIAAKDSVIKDQAALKQEKAIVKKEQVTKPDSSQTKVEETVIAKSYPDPKDTNYVKWAKKTAGMFEAMDPKKAAKIIEKYSDNIARDIIYGMKKKKAAEILAELNPDTASRIARMP